MSHQEPSTESAHRFLATLGELGSPLPGTGVHGAALGDDSAAALAAVARLRRYRDYLAHARQYKATGAGTAGDIDKQALTEGRAALDDFHTLVASTVKAVQNLARGGAVDRMTESWRHAAAAAGIVSTRDLWDVLAAGSTRDALRDAGVDDAQFEELGAVVKEPDLRLSVDGSSLRVTGYANGDTVNESLATTPRPAPPADALALLSRRFDALADGLQRGEPAYLSGMPLVEGDVHFEDVAIYSALGTQREGIRHVRKLEDTGLETYLGGAVVIGIIVFVLLVYAIYGISRCYHPDPEIGQPPPHPDPEEEKRRQRDCVLGVLLGLFFILLGLSGGGSKTSSTDPRQMVGSALMHGALTDFGRSAT